MKHTQRLQLMLTGIGFASFLCMNSFSLWGLSFLPLFAFGESSFAYWSTPIAVCNIVTFFIYFLGSTRFPQLFNRAPFIEAVLLLSLGMIFLLGFYLSQSLVILTIAGVFVGIGTTCCFICWEKAFSLSPEREAHKQILLGSILVLVPFTGFIAMGQSVLLFAMLLLVFCTLSLLYVCLRFKGGQASFDESITSNPESHKRIGKQFWKPLICIVMIGVISPVLGSVAFSGERNFLESSIIVFCANTVTSLILGIVWLVFKKRVTISGTYIVIFPVLITAFLLFPFMEESYRVIILFIGSLGFTLFSIVMMMSCISTAREKQISLVFVYSLFAGVTYASRFLGEGLASIVSSSSLSQETQIITSVFLLLYGCSLVMFVLMRKPKAKNEVADQPVGIDVLKETCETLAAKNGFSVRQTEVLDLLAHGYDVPSVAKKLFISENTVRSHTKKIYVLLGVHSRQQIIELVNKGVEESRIVTEEDL